MCGIAGLCCARGAACDATTLERMALSLAHRGPDGTRTRLMGSTGFVHTRLAIVDLAGGAQPITVGTGTIVANGEIYNDPSLRAGPLQGETFSTHSDCEPALHMWMREGPGFASSLRGMYAIALGEGGQGHQEEVLSRDPFGIKPLYYAERPQGVAFASEPRALLDSGVVPRAVDPGVRAELLGLQFTTGRETIFPGIRRVLPGETIQIADGRVLHRHRLSPMPEGPIETITEDAALARLDRALEDSVQAHERADVPFGLFLSGGVDSASVLAVMARLGRTRGAGSLKAWTASFDARGAADETAQAAHLASVAGAEHRVLRITRDMVWAHLPAIVACMDDPAADYAIIPTWLLAREARREVKVILSGEGGDELFAGYGRYRRAMKPWWRGGRRMRRRAIFDGLGILRDDLPGWRRGIDAAELDARHWSSRLQQAQAVDIAEWLPNDLLLKLDRCLMAHAVEGRTPLLDPVVAQAVWRLPDSMKVRDGRGKWLLRRWLAGAMPDARPFAPKQGFTVPIGAWIAEDGGRLGPLVARQPVIRELAHPERVEALFHACAGHRTAAAAWSLLFYALWHRALIEERPVTGNVFDVLGDR
ncbi:asparagine synthetase [Ameyamaea chiangmaiensis NBRC 103196]|uniref:asparagine synthase (glutamine-hydrolyzing) n=1 Tax=Ameyamaea chiangmaiensis TaxID=442969 RepID=A0A850PII7_9PROT|nr:asparagine synthase (glutamine-hydrolyzing) [Ameyamaea chiangmaiensis]MBS4074259.1 asparagine synthase (glutamine-hydrolyzing) [Ameyamaea chiangmaiensis]NVN41622.1 asparagine synthase (glutamine-hydrolyzing) [Ameyamaea chiangmaiensis]GBQ71409.1 asparagine synthetase [Ameyamaea chiangmaiensis NBRC 103196]